jgi:hypothetical protein
MKKENEVTEIIEKNNRNLKAIDKGQNQESFQWVDLTANVSYLLSADEVSIKGYYFVSYMATAEQ